MTQAGEIAGGLLDLVYPPKCLVCQEFNPAYLCPSCISKIAPVPRPYCVTCGHPLRGEECRNCRGRARSFTAARAAGDFDGALRQAIHEFKYHGARMLAEPLAQLIHGYLTEHADFPWRRADCIVPVPIHPARRRYRGYNQSELLAERLGEMVDIPMIADAVVRRRYTDPQVELTGEERRINMRGAFSVTRPSAVKAKIILLVDDVATTCSTVHECSAVLLAAGAARVYVSCLAFDA